MQDDRDRREERIEKHDEPIDKTKAREEQTPEKEVECSREDEHHSSRWCVVSFGEIPMREKETKSAEIREGENHD